MRPVSGKSNLKLPGATCLEALYYSLRVMTRGLAVLEEWSLSNHLDRSTCQLCRQAHDSSRLPQQLLSAQHPSEALQAVQCCMSGLRGHIAAGPMCDIPTAGIGAYSIHICTCCCMKLTDRREHLVKHKPRRPQTAGSRRCCFHSCDHRGSEAACSASTELLWQAPSLESSQIYQA